MSINIPVTFYVPSTIDNLKISVYMGVFNFKLNGLWRRAVQRGGAVRRKTLLGIPQLSM